MFNKKTFIVTVFLCIVSCGLSFYSAAVVVRNSLGETVSEKEEVKQIIVNGTEIISEDKTEEENKIEKQEDTVASSAAEKITPSTKMVYEYYFPEDGITERQEDSPPYFLLDLTLSDLLKYYKNWEVVSFSDREVIMRKNMEGKSSQHYIVGEKDGYIAVYYQEEIDGRGLREVTDTPLAALPDEEQEMLKKGIFVDGEQALARILEGYDS